MAEDYDSNTDKLHCTTCSQGDQQGVIGLFLNKLQHNPFAPDMATDLFRAMLTGAFIWPIVFHEPVSGLHSARPKKEIIQIFPARYVKQSGQA